MNALANYDAACHALQQAASVDEVLNIRDQAEAMRAYGRQAKNKELETYAQEIRLRAERKLGALITAQKQTHGLNTGAKGIGKSVLVTDEGTPTLAEMGISYDLSSRAQKLAAVPDAEFEENLVEHKQRVAAENARVVNKLEVAGEKAMGKKPAKPATPVADEALVADNARLLSELSELSEFLATLQQMLKETQDENETFARIVEADDQLAAALAEVKRHKAIAESAERTLAAKSGEFVERARAVTHWKNRAEKAEKALARMEKAA